MTDTCARGEDWRYRVYPGKLAWWHRWLDLPSAGEIRWYIEQMEERIMSTLEDVQGQIAAANEATNNIAADVQGLKDKLDAALADVQGQIDTAVAATLQQVSDGLGPVVEKLQGVAASTPDAEPTPEPAPEG